MHQILYIRRVYRITVQVKIIVPNTTAGLIIGKGGATIRHIMESSGAKVQLSQKPEQINLQVNSLSAGKIAHSSLYTQNYSLHTHTPVSFLRFFSFVTKFFFPGSMNLKESLMQESRFWSFDQPGLV